MIKIKDFDVNSECKFSNIHIYIRRLHVFLSLCTKYSFLAVFSFTHSAHKFSLIYHFVNGFKRKSNTNEDPNYDYYDIRIFRILIAIICICCLFIICSFNIYF